MKKTVKKHYLKLAEWSEEDGCYVGRCPELFLGGVHGDDEAKVYRELCVAVADVLAAKERRGDPLPASLAGKNFSGSSSCALRRNCIARSRCAPCRRATASTISW